MSQQLRENVITLLGSVVVDMQAVATTSILTVPLTPVPFTMVVTHIVVRSNTATLAGGSDYDFGDTSGGDFFKSTVDLSSMTSADGYWIIENSNALLALFAAGVSFDIDVITGSTGAANATIEVFGYMF